MKLLSLVLALCLVTGLAFADVTAEIIAKDIDDNGNIRIWTQYKIDGVEVISQYPKINGKSVYATRFNAHSFAGMTDAQIEKRILWDSKIHCNTLVKKEFIEKTISTNSEIFDKHIKTIIGKTVSDDTAEIKVDENTTIKVKTDGTQTVSISP